MSAQEPQIHWHLFIARRAILEAKVKRSANLRLPWIVRSKLRRIENGKVQHNVSTEKC